MDRAGLRDAVVLVTGASGGIGAEVAKSLGREGARVALTGRSRERLDAVATSVEREGGEAVALPFDLTGPEPEALVEQTIARFGAIHGVVSCAGGARFTYFTRQSKAELDAALRLNLTAPIDLVRAALPSMMEARRSYAVFVNTIAAREPAPPRGTAYLPAKAGLLHFAESLFAELRDRGVTVCSILPDLTDTPLVPDALGYDRSTLIRPASVASAVLFAMKSPPDVCVTEIHLRPQPSLRKAPT